MFSLLSNLEFTMFYFCQYASEASYSSKILKYILKKLLIFVILSMKLYETFSVI